MSKMILWATMNIIMALTLLAAACGPAAAPATPVAPMTPPASTEPAIPATTATPVTPSTPVQEKPQQEAVKPGAEMPQYGGTITYRLPSDPTSFDSGYGRANGSALYAFVYQKYITLDWEKGPAGSGITNFAAGNSAVEDLLRPELAESWQMPEQGLWILQIRRGVRWQPVNSEAGRLMAGREMTADDIVNSFNRMIGPDAWVQAAQPVVAKAASIAKTGAWEVTIRTPVDHFTGLFWLVWGGLHNAVYPPEVATKYGNVANWRNAVGTGPYMLIEYVPGSQLLYNKNPNYWEKDPLGPGKGSQLPYVDSVRALVIPDMSTTLAGLRTGKLDFLTPLTHEEWQTIMKSNPSIQHVGFLPNNYNQISVILDKPELPYDDVRVRQALMLATDFNSIKNNYYRGQAVIDVRPVNQNFKGSGFTPLEEMPESVQALFRYDPDRAKQLLKEAGYPNGFKADILVSNTGYNVDEVAIFKDMWTKVGIELNLQVKDPGTYASIVNARTWEHMLYSNASATAQITWSFSAFRGTTPASPSRTDIAQPKDTVIEDTWAKLDKKILKDMPTVYEEFKKLKPYILEQSWVIPRPSPYSYSVWWPWLKNYYGQGLFIGGFLRYAWIDRELKKSMGF